MNSLLVVAKLATSNYGLAQAVYKAHQAAREEPYLVDFPGLDNPRWADRREHSVGRFALIYASESLARLVHGQLECIRQQACDNQAFAVMRLPLSALAGLKLWDGVSTARVRRHALRKASEAASKKSAQRLQAKLLRDGRALTSPIVEHVRCVVDAQGRWGAVLDPGTPMECVVKTVLTLPSSSGKHFSNALTRESSTDPAFFGARDSYGFAVGVQGCSVPRVDERLLFAALIGEETTSDEAIDA